MQAEDETPGRGLWWWLLGAVFALVAVGYGAVATSFFLSDDFNYLNIALPARTLAEGTGIAAGWVFFRPLTAISFWWNAQVFGKDPAAYHLLGLAFHGLNAWLVARLAWQMFQNRLGAAVAGLSFAVFPVHPEAVTWISARADVLSATGMLVCLSGWIDFLRGPHRSRALAWTWVGLVWALLTKDSAMILPLPMLFLLAIECRRPVGRLILVGLASIGLVFAGYLIARFAVLGGFGGHPGVEGSKHVQINLPVAVRFTVDAVRCMVMPGTTAVLPWVTVGLLAVLLGCAVRRRTLAALLRRGWPLAVLFLLALAPVANMVTLDLDNGQETRFLYIPSMFACAGIGVLVGVTAAAGRSLVLVGAALLLVASHAVSLRLENQRWHFAAAEAESILDQLRGLAATKAYTMVFIYGLPNHIDGAYVFRNGFDTAIRLFVDPKLEFPSHGKISLADWEKFSARRRAEPEFNADILLVRWDPATRRLIEP